MKANLRSHRKAPNKAFMLTIATAKAACEVLGERDFDPAQVDHLSDTLGNVWRVWADAYRADAEKLRFSTNVRYRKNPDDDYLIWLTWGTSNGGDLLATIILSKA